MEITQECREKLRKQIVDLNGRVVYTYTAQHKFADSLEANNKKIRVAQIILTATSAVGIFAKVITNQYWSNWVGCIASVLALGLTLFTKEFSLIDQIQKHRDAANELWDVREKFASLITDFCGLEYDDIRAKRDEITEKWSQINKKYPATDKISYKAAQEALKNEEEQTFNEGEAEKFLPC